MLSPIRVSMGVGVLKLASGSQTGAAVLTESDLYRRALLLALAPVTVGLAAVSLLAMLAH
jgi:hypothetical protein